MTQDTALTSGAIGVDESLVVGVVLGIGVKVDGQTDSNMNFFLCSGKPRKNTTGDFSSSTERQTDREREETKK